MDDKNGSGTSPCEHDWKDDSPRSGVVPPISTRACTKCGKRQVFKPAEWCDT